MIDADDRILVAVSGGPDSVALLAVLHELRARLGIHLVVGHVNHKLRGAESDRDEAVAAAAAQQLEIPFVVDVCAGLGSGPSLEARARRYRYEALQRLCDEHACSKIATAHTRDDQVETVLLRLIRGTGARGLVGILPVRDDGVVRPFLACTRAQIMEFLGTGQIPWAHDSSNDERTFLRNRVRHELLPLLRQFNPSFDVVLVENAATMAAESQWLDRLLRQTTAEHSLLPSTPLLIEELRRVAEPLQSRFLRLWIESQAGSLHGIDACHIASVRRLAAGRRPSGEVYLPGGTLIVREYGRLRREAHAAIVTFPPAVLHPGIPLLLPSGWRFTRHERPAPENRPKDHWTFLADATLLSGEITVRPPQPGERMAILGSTGHRKLQDLFVNAKVPRRRRAVYPVVDCGGSVVWVPGLARGTTALVGDATSETIEIVAIPPGPHDPAVHPD